MAAGDCMTRAWALAIATAACVGLPCALVYAVVRVASTHRHLATTIALAAFLAVWVAVSAAYYPCAFADILRWFALSRYLRGHRGSRAQRHTTTTRRRALLTRFVVALAPSTSSQHQQGNNGALVPPPSMAARRSWQEEEEDHGGGIGAFPREAPAAARGGALVVGGAGDALVACKMRCVVCLCDVEKVETAAWLPACMHVFHRHCIERWLHDHSTCPICRALVAAAVEESETL